MGTTPGAPSGTRSEEVNQNGSSLGSCEWGTKSSHRSNVRGPRPMEARQYLKFDVEISSVEISSDRFSPIPPPSRCQKSFFLLRPSLDSSGCTPRRGSQVGTE